VDTISPNSYGISTKDDGFRAALNDCDFLVLDGVYFALASILLNKTNIKKNQGPELFTHFINRMNNVHGKVFFLGSSNETLLKIKNRAELDYPNITIGTYSPPFKDEFTDSENLEILQVINNFKPDLIFVGMTCPKQEKWAHKNKEHLNLSIVCCVGAVFDWYAGNQKDIHPFWWKIRLGWLKRTIDRPEILFRYPTIAIFFKDLFLSLIGVKKYDI
jgi:N-acetylglucosaminyldiphosphoundecaprenol N-acetyl-beta-D-mannosaminyltransferase